MKNIIQLCLLFGSENIFYYSFNKNMSVRKSNGIFAKMKYVSLIRIMTIGLFGICTMNLYSQEGEVVNEGIFQIKSFTIVSSLSDFTNEQTGELTNDGDFILKANFSNYGEMGFSSLLDGYTLFEGYQEQELSGSNPINLKHVLFANQISGISFFLDNDLNIYGTANFTSGIVDNTNYLGHLTFYENADNVNTSDNSHVNGAVYKMGKNDFTFPIGKGGFYRMAGLSKLPDLGNIYKATYYLENSNELHPHSLKPDGVEEIDNQEYWTIKQESPMTEDILITLSWNEVTTPVHIHAEAADNGITIVRWDVETNMWIDEGGVPDVDAQTVTTSIKTDGLFTLAKVKTNITLPCNIVVYSAVTPNGDGINDYFRIDTPNDGCVKDLNVMVFNRWGVKVFESNNYGPKGDVFDGFSSGRLTLNHGNQLPSGTYFYILNYQYDSDSEVKSHKEAGYLHLSGN